MRSRQMVPLLVALLVITVSCGGDGSVFETGSTTSLPQVEDVVNAEARAAAEMIVADLGPEPGMLAVGYALDRGYTAGQIAAGGREGALQADGTIVGVEPAVHLWGLFSDLPAAGGSTGGGRDAPGWLLALAEDPDQVDADSWKRGLAANFDTLISGPAGSPLSAEDQDMAVVMIALILGLADMGYSADQIILGIAADEWALGWIPTTHWLCWHLRDAQGNIIAPARPAGGSFPDTEVCRPLIDEASSSSTTSSTTTTSTSTTTTTAAPDPDGIANGVYTGDVRLVADVGAPVYELSDTLTELEVTDDAVRATVEFTARVSIRVRGIEPVCIATTRRTYFGQGSPAASIDVLMEPQFQEIVSLEGPECGVVEGWWSTTAEADLLAEFAEELSFSLVGSFGPGIFEGTIAEVLGVSASLGG